MFIELVDSLRCVRAHEDSWLVASADELVARHIVRGELGCPVCEARYPVREGVVDFRLRADVESVEHVERVDDSSIAVKLSATRRAEHAGDAHDAAPRDARSARSDLAVRAAALLGLSEPGGYVVLAGEWSAASDELLAIVGDVHLLALDPALGVESGGALSLARIAQVLPLAAGSVRGVALDAAHATPSLLAGAALALAPGGRLIAPASALVPDSLAELARDDDHWVAAATTSKVSAPVPIGIRR